MADYYGISKQLEKKFLLVCALEVETQGQLDDYDVLYTGVGKVNATLKLTQKFGKYGSYIPYDLVINYGTAGSRKYRKGELVDCTKFIQRDMDVTGLGFQRGETPFEKQPPLVIETESLFNPIGKNATCGSGDSFVEDRSQYYGEVVDMEAYALSKVCYHYQIPFISFKYISDGADDNANDDWDENVSKGIEVFKEKVLEGLK
tara:strand:- start:1173 stop:1781 length:609 start_codon:yes stop_codon:yes gene_type:complete